MYHMIFCDFDLCMSRNQVMREYHLIHCSTNVVDNCSAYVICCFLFGLLSFIRDLLKESVQEMSIFMCHHCSLLCQICFAQVHWKNWWSESSSATLHITHAQSEILAVNLANLLLIGTRWCMRIHMMNSCLRVTVLAHMTLCHFL